MWCGGSGEGFLGEERLVVAVVYCELSGPEEA